MGKYKVVGVQPVDGHAPGTVFEAEYDEAKEERLIALGAIEKARSTTRTKEGSED